MKFNGDGTDIIIIIIIIIIIKNIYWPDRNLNTSQIQQSSLFHWSNGTIEHTWYTLLTAWIQKHNHILGLHSGDEADMLVYKTIAKCRSGFA